MDLLEYQAKELFQKQGIPVLPSQRIDRSNDLKWLKIPYPVVLKSQVYSGGRGRLGGIRFVENTIDAIAAAQIIFNLPIQGEYPKALLAEAKYDAQQEFYLAVTLNRTNRRPMLLGSSQGGVDVESAIDQMQSVIVDREFSPFYARRLALKMGLQGDLVRSVSDIIEKMYRLFVEKDLDLVEINPLGVSTSGEVMALDGKIRANDDALDRHEDLVTLAAEMTPPGHFPGQSLRMVELDGNIGILCNGAGLAMTTMDLICRAGGKPACVLNIGGETQHDWQPAILCDRLEQGLELITQTKQVKVVLINLVSGTVSEDDITQVIANYLQNRPRNNRSISEIRGDSLAGRSVRLPHLFVRLVEGSHPSQPPNSTAQLTWVSSLDDAIEQTTALAQVVAGSP